LKILQFRSLSRVIRKGRKRWAVESGGESELL